MASLPILLLGATALYILYYIVDFLTLHFYHPSQPLAAYKRKGNEPTYALITGSSGGIGLGIAQELVTQGFGVILLGHLPAELAEAKASLELRTPGAAVRTITMDVVSATPADLDSLALSLKDLKLSILFNNVGGTPYHLPMRELSTMTCVDIDNTINMNARFMSRLTSIILPQLARRATPGERSLIVNLSSASHVGLPWVTIYSATKAYNLAFSASLSRELIANPATRHVDCLAITPGDVQSQSNTQASVTNSPTWDAYGRCLVITLDNAIMRGLKVFIPYWFHDFTLRMVPWLPESVKQSTFTNVIGAKKAAWEAEAAKAK